MSEGLDLKAFLVCSILVGIIFMIFDMVIAIVTIPVYQPYAHLAIWNDTPNIIAGTVFDIINGFILVLVYVILYDAIPGEQWKKGLSYGIIVGLFRVVMMTFSIIVMYAIPIEIIRVSLIIGYIEIVILCIILAILSEKLKVKNPA